MIHLGLIIAIQTGSRDGIQTNLLTFIRTLVLSGLVGGACDVYKCARDQLVCPRCASVGATSQPTVCSNCGYDFSRPFARIRSVASQYLWLMIFLLPFSVAAIRSGLVFCAIVAVFVLLAIGFSLTEKMRQSLSLNAPKVHVPVSMSKPGLPAGWEPIARVPRPRDVYSPPATKALSVLLASGCVVAAVFAIYTLWKNSAVAVQGTSPLAGNNWVLLLWTVGFISIGAANLRRSLIEREVLRDGELTPGVLTDWSKGRHGISIRYQFWTSSGQRFEGSGMLNSRCDLKDSDGIFPVFYLGHQPKSSLALCCTGLRIRTHRVELFDPI